MEKFTTSIIQIAKTIQGEGFNLGTAVLLLRFSGCNLNCSYCDTRHSIYGNNAPNKLMFGRLNYILDDENKINKIVDFIHNEIGNIETLMITGGEPFMLNNFYYISEILSRLKLRNINVEIESNGTLIQRHQIYKLVNIIGLKHLTLNISPKIEAECYYGDSNVTQIVLPIIKRLKCLEHKLNKNIFRYKMLFKPEYMDNAAFYDILSALNKDEVCIMPLTKNPKLFDNFEDFLSDYHQRCMKTLSFCVDNGHKFSPREHLFLFRHDETEKINVR